jgi:tetratricopeptide (TPR) repeat protein
LDVFTDREELIAAFERNLAHKQPQDNRVLVFYGDGGIGKTTLLQKLELLHRQRCPQALMGRLDLAGADTTPPDLLLYRLRRLFPTIPFPSFSLALAEYGRRFHPEQVYGSDRKELLSGAGPYADVLAGGLEVLGQLSGVGLAINAMKAAATAQRQLSDWVQRRAEPWLQRSQSYSEEQLLAQLPLQWARDFRQALSSQLDQGWDDAITYSGPPPLIAFDTYETLWHSGMGRSGRRREPRERWLVDLVSELPEVLWVIGGRDRLSWEEGYDQDWSEACEQHLIGQLSDEDARSFLAKRGIKEPAIVEKILRQAAGVPFYLELETQLYDETPAEERTPEVFGGSQKKQIERLLTHLDNSERATLKLMAAFGIWDRELFSQAVSHFDTGYPATGAAELGRFWSIEPIGEDRWQLHNEMAHHLQADERQRDHITFEKVHRWGFAYFDGPLEGLEEKKTVAEDVERLQRALRHAQYICSASEWVSWIAERAWKLVECKFQSQLLSVVEMSLSEAVDRLGEYHESILGLARVKGGLLLRLGKYREAKNAFTHAFLISTINYGDDDINTCVTLNDLACADIGLEDYAEAEVLLYRDLYLLLLEYPEHKLMATYMPDPYFPSIAAPLNNLASVLERTNQLDEAETLYYIAIRICDSQGGEYTKDLAACLGNLGALLADRGRCTEAEPLIRRAIKVQQKEFGSSHPSVAKVLAKLAHIMLLENRITDAQEIYDQCLKINQSCFGIYHPEVLENLDALLKIYLTTEALDRAEECFLQMLTIAKAIHGPNHFSIAILLNNYAALLKGKNNLSNAERHCRLALSIAESSTIAGEKSQVGELLGIKPPADDSQAGSLLKRSILSNLADILRLNRESSADEIKRLQESIGEYAEKEQDQSLEPEPDPASRYRFQELKRSLDFNFPL